MMRERSAYSELTSPVRPLRSGSRAVPSASAVPQFCHPERSGEAWEESKDLKLPVGFRAEPLREELPRCVPLTIAADANVKAKRQMRSAPPLPTEARGPSTAPMVVSTAPQTSRKASSPRSAANDVLCKRLKIRMRGWIGFSEPARPARTDGKRWAAEPRFLCHRPACGTERDPPARFLSAKIEAPAPSTSLSS